MEQKITYRIATNDDYSAVLLLYNQMYKSNRSLEDFKWLVEDNPSGKAVLFIALISEEVVGMQSLIPYTFLRNNEIIKTYKSEDTLVLKKMRSRGIFSNLYEMVHEYAGETLIWGLTDKKEILTNVNMPSSERLTIVVSVNKPTLDFGNNGFQKFVAKTIFYSLLYLKSSFRTKSPNSKLLLKEVKSSEFGNSKLQFFFEKLSKNYPEILFPKMDAEYLNWRLTNNPNLERYQIVCSHDGNEEIVICSIIGFQGKSAYWESFYALPHVPHNDKIAHIAQLKDRIFNSGVNLLHSWLFECNNQVKEVKANFYEAGFSKVRDGLWIVHNSTDKKLNVHDLYFSPQLGIR